MVPLLGAGQITLLVTEKTRKMIAEILVAARPSLKEIAAEVGVTYAALHAWVTGRRNPTPEHVKGLAGALRRRGGELAELAQELEEAAGE